MAVNRRPMANLSIDASRSVVSPVLIHHETSLKSDKCFGRSSVRSSARLENLLSSKRRYVQVTTAAATMNCTVGEERREPKTYLVICVFPADPQSHPDHTKKSSSFITMKTMPIPQLAILLPFVVV